MNKINKIREIDEEMNQILSIIIKKKLDGCDLLLQHVGQLSFERERLINEVRKEKAP